MVRDPYAALQVGKSASTDEIKKAYRKLAKKYHPDLNPGNKEAEKRFKEITEAYDLLTDPKKREQFDRFGAAAFTEGFEQAQRQRQGPFYYQTQGGPDARYSQGFSFDEDLFETLFGGIRGGRPGAGAGFDLRGQDALYQMEVDFLTAVRGGEREITLPNGKRLRVKIPPGVDSGTRLRFAGMGNSGTGKAPPGDAYVEISVLPSDFFKRVGNDIEVEVPVSLKEAVLGAEIRVPTISGDVMLKVPAGVTTGSRLRIKGRGVPPKTGGSAGDQFVRLNVALPKQVDPELQDLVRKWSEKHDYNPREESGHAA